MTEVEVRYSELSKLYIPTTSFFLTTPIFAPWPNKHGTLIESKTVSVGQDVVSQDYPELGQFRISEKLRGDNTLIEIGINFDSYYGKNIKVYEGLREWEESNFSWRVNYVAVINPRRQRFVFIVNTQKARSVEFRLSPDSYQESLVGARLRPTPPTLRASAELKPPPAA